MIKGEIWMIGKMIEEKRKKIEREKKVETAKNVATGTVIGKIGRASCRERV